MIEFVRKEIAHMSEFQKSLAAEYNEKDGKGLFERNRCSYIAEGLDMALKIIDKYILGK